jgi:hypothetical protein
MRSTLCMLVIAFAASNIACASMGMGSHADGVDCQNLGVFPGKAQGPALDPFPQNATEADRTNWKKNMNERYVSLKSEAVSEAQKGALAAGATHIQYQEAMVTNNPDKSMKGAVNIIGYKCPMDKSAPNGTFAANDPFPEQHGSATFK